MNAYQTLIIALTKGGAYELSSCQWLATYWAGKLAREYAAELSDFSAEEIEAACGRVLLEW
jgi:hypothetical protein